MPWWPKYSRPERAPLFSELSQTYGRQIMCSYNRRTCGLYSAQRCMNEAGRLKCPLIILYSSLHCGAAERHNEHCRHAVTSAEWSVYTNTHESRQLQVYNKHSLNTWSSAIELHGRALSIATLAEIGKALARMRCHVCFPVPRTLRKSRGLCGWT